ncbi:MAG: hypothetical protein H6622_18150 [Halobacteriovoraceae bacterium]|nr:hypothetical protein [Halobacteriovoraceae bacterium]
MKNNIISDFIKHFEIPLEQQYTHCSECEIRMHYSRADIIGDRVICPKCLDFMWKFERWKVEIFSEDENTHA